MSVPVQYAMCWFSRYFQTTDESFAVFNEIIGSKLTIFLIGVLIILTFEWDDFFLASKSLIYFVLKYVRKLAVDWTSYILSRSNPTSKCSCPLGFPSFFNMK